MATILPPREPDDKDKRYIGLDLSKQETQLSLLNAGGKEIHTRRFVSDRDAFLKLASELGPLDSVALEVTTNSFAIARILMTSGANVVISDPIRTRIIAESKFKTDKIDARKLAELLRVDYLPTVWLPDLETEQLRHLMSDRQSLVDRRTELKNRVHGVLHRNMAKISASDIFGPSGRATLELIGATPIQRPIDPTEAGSGTADVKSSKRVGAANPVAADLPAFNAYDQFSLRSTLSDIDHLDARVRELDSLIASFICSVPWMLENMDLLLSVTGVGMVVGAGFLAAIGDISRFKRAKELASYFGLVTSTFQTGASAAYHGRITKRGRAQARWLAVEAAEHLRKSPGPLRAFYTRIAKKRGRNVAVVALARKLAELCWHILTRKEDFIYSVPRLTEEKRANLRLLARNSNAIQAHREPERSKGGGKTRSPLQGTGLSGRIVKAKIAGIAATSAESEYRQTIAAREKNSSRDNHICKTTGNRSASGFNPLRPNHVDWQRVLEAVAAQFLKKGENGEQLKGTNKR